MKRLRFPWAAEKVEVKGVTLTLPDDYDIMCALRGPDAEFTTALKWATTARIRHLVGMGVNQGGVVNPSPSVSNSELACEQFDDWTRGGRYHWANHLESCLDKMKGDLRFDQRIVSIIRADLKGIRKAVHV